MSDPRCGNCDYWLGESVEPLVRLDHVSKSDEATIEPPRDLRKCSSCGRVNVFVPLADLRNESGRCKVAPQTS